MFYQKNSTNTYIVKMINVLFAKAELFAKLSSSEGTWNTHDQCDQIW